MFKLCVAALMMIFFASLADAQVGMKGSAKRLCWEAGYQPPSPDFYECSRTAIMVAKPKLHYQLTGRFAQPRVQEVQHTADNPATEWMFLDSLDLSSGQPRPPVRQESRLAQDATIAQATARTCKGSVKKGLKAHQAGDHETALCHWLPKAMAGDPAAQNNMGVLFESGLTTRTPQSDEHAAGWYLLSAKQGFVPGMQNLAKVQARLGYHEAAASWLAMAAATEQQNQQAMQQGMNSLAYSLGCALAGGCSGPAPTPAYVPQQPVRSLSQSSAGSGDREMRMCPDGSYVSGQCRMAPDGTYVGGNPTMAPDGSYVAGTPRLAPNGSYIGGTGPMIMCPDGSYVTGTRCQLSPAGTYVGR